MMSYLNGNKIKYVSGAWFYEDNSHVNLNSIKPCPKCGKTPTSEGHDACIGNLPGVSYACCGHGNHRGYIQFTNGITIRGNFEIEYPI